MSIKYKKTKPTEYVIKVKKGKIAQQGLGLSVLYNTATTSMMIVPAVAFDTSFMFDELMTNDFQRVSVQGDISYTISNFEQASKMVDFTYINEKQYLETLAEARQKMAKRIINLTQVYVTKFLSGKSVKEAIISGDELARAIREDIVKDETILDFGLSVISISILKIQPQLETRKALEAATREEILKQQDDAIYKRRNAAIEQERIVKENELNTEIKVAEKQKQKKEKEMETKRLIQERQAELDAVQLANNIRLEEENKRLVELQAENDRKKYETKAYETEVIMNTYKNVDVEVLKVLAMSGMDSKSLIAKAFLEIGDKAGKIGTLNVSPDLLETLMQN